MRSTGPAGRAAGWLAAWGWYGLAGLACLALLAINDGPLFYFDTGGYLAQGRSMFNVLGLLPGSSTAPGAAETAHAISADGTVVASRSATYALFLMGLYQTLGLGAVPMVQSALLILSVYLAVRVIARLHAPGLDVPRTTALAVLAGCLGAAPFYTAYLMPDIFAPVLILSVALLAVAAPALRGWELLLTLGLGIFAVTTHPSHAGIATLMVPAAAVLGALFRIRRFWIGVALIALIALAAAAERAAFSLTVKSVARADVTYKPFLTARLIEDGPGWAYLTETCPDPGLESCALREAIDGQPQRMYASDILYSTDEAHGSLARMPLEQQKRIAAEQARFAELVVKSHPFGVAAAVLRNSARQLVHISVAMTLPVDEMGARVAALTGYLPAALAHARLTEIPAWLGWLDAAHGALYLASAAALAALTALPGSALPAALRVLALMVVAGIVANAGICGALSQPADRYGARVLFLLPLTAALLWIVSRRRRVVDAFGSREG